MRDDGGNVFLAKAAVMNVTTGRHKAEAEPDCGLPRIQLLSQYLPNSCAIRRARCHPTQPKFCPTLKSRIYMPTCIRSPSRPRRRAFHYCRRSSTGFSLCVLNFQIISKSHGTAAGIARKVTESNHTG